MPYFFLTAPTGEYSERNCVSGRVNMQEVGTQRETTAITHVLAMVRHVSLHGDCPQSRGAEEYIDHGTH